jgi:hypothetical protein
MSISNDFVLSMGFLCLVCVDLVTIVERRKVPFELPPCLRVEVLELTILRNASILHRAELSGRSTRQQEFLDLAVLFIQPFRRAYDKKWHACVIFLPLLDPYEPTGTVRIRARE